MKRFGQACAAAAIVAALGGVACAPDATGPSLGGDAGGSTLARHEAPLPRFGNQGPDAAYVGRDACRPCHVGKWTGYAGTGMGRSFYPMNSDREIEDWSGNNRLELPGGLVYEMTSRNGAYRQRQLVIGADGRETMADEYELRWVVGSGTHTRAYLVERDGALFQAPVCWYPDLSGWDLCPGYEFKNDNFTRETSTSCVFCHNGVMRAVDDERNRFVEPYPHGIGCERCHGPGSLHVARWSAPDAEPTGELDPTIVNPARLPETRRIEVCSQCHLGDAKSTERVLRSGAELEDYRPGMPLESWMTPFRYAQSTQWDFGLSAQVDRLVLSRCWKESGGRVECLDCHDPHVSVYEDPDAGPRFRRACLECHAAADCGAPAERRASTPRLADDCVACHMRSAEPDDQRHTHFTDHWIRRDPTLVEPDRRDAFSLEPVFADRLAALPPAERLYARARAEQLFAIDAPGELRAEHQTRAIEGFRAAIDAGFDTGDAWFFLGKTLMLAGHLDEAATALRSALEREPGRHDATFALGQCMGALGDTRGAMEIFDGMLTVDPADPAALAEYGRAAFALGRGDLALAAYRSAVRARPWDATLWKNLGMTLAAAGRFDESVDCGVRATTLDPDDPEMWRFYANTLDAAGRTIEARAARDTMARFDGSGGGDTPSGMR